MSVFVFACRSVDAIMSKPSSSLASNMTALVNPPVAFGSGRETIIPRLLSGDAGWASEPEVRNTPPTQFIGPCTHPAATQ